MCEGIVGPLTNQSVFTFLSEFCSPSAGQVAVEVTFLTVILIVGVTGNSMVLMAVFRSLKLRTVTNVLACNLAVTDMLFVTGVPFIVVTRVTKHWILGEFVCKVVTYVQFVSGVCSIVTMTTISIERYTAVCLMNKYRIMNRHMRLIILVIWTISCSFPVPVALAQTIQTIDNFGESFQFCGVEWPNGFHSHVYLGFMASFFFVIPLTVISVLYFKILKVVYASMQRTKLAHTSQKSAKKQLRLVKMLVSIVVLFVIMWLPFFVISFLGVQLKQITSTHFTVTLILALANTCQNPVLYGYFNNRFREEFKAMCLCCRRSLQRIKSSKSAGVAQGTQPRSVELRSVNMEDET